MKDKIIDIIIELSESDLIKENINIDLIENEILDSFAFITLITRLEEEFDIELQPTQINPNTWRSIDSITQLVIDKIGE